MTKKVAGITRIYMTTRRLKVSGFYEDGTVFEFTVDSDSKKSKKYFELAHTFAKEFHSLVNG